MKNSDKTFHYTNEQMVKDLIAMTPFKGSVLDAGSGKNKVWFNNLKGEKYECELEEGNDFYEWDKPVDWIVGNPPFHESYKFVMKAAEIAQAGFAFLLNNQAMNSMTPGRWQQIRDKGFYLQRLHCVGDKRWFGRYWYLIFTKEPNDFVSWTEKTY